MQAGFFSGKASSAFLVGVVLWMAGTAAMAENMYSMQGMAGMHAQIRPTKEMMASFKPATASVQGDVVQILNHQYPRKMTLGGKQLAANGAAVRYVEMETRYSAILWTAKPVHSEAELVADNSPKRMVFTMLRPIPTNNFSKRVLKGINKNLDEADKVDVLLGMSQLGQLFGKEMVMPAGSTFVMDWTPEKGTLISLMDKHQTNPVKGKAFFEALMGMWFGKSPAEKQFKDSMMAGWPH